MFENKMKHLVTCPNCGSNMYKKIGEYGQFLGCEMFSKNGCTGTRPFNYKSPSQRELNAKEFRQIIFDSTERVEMAAHIPWPKLYEPSTDVMNQLMRSVNPITETVTYVLKLSAEDEMALKGAYELQKAIEKSMGISQELVQENLNNNGVITMNKTDYTAQILNDKYEIAVVKYPSPTYDDNGKKIGETTDGKIKHYYKISPSMGVKPDDVLLVSISDDYARVNCVEVLPNNDAIYRDKMMNWIVCKFDDSAYQNSIKHEREIIRLIKEEDVKIAAKEKAHEAINKYSSGFVSKFICEDS